MRTVWSVGEGHGPNGVTEGIARDNKNRSSDSQNQSSLMKSTV